MLDVGCNSGDLTRSLHCVATAAAVSEGGGDAVYTLGVDVDGELVRRAQDQAAAEQKRKGGPAQDAVHFLEVNGATDGFEAAVLGPLAKFEQAFDTTGASVGLRCVAMRSSIL